MSKINPAITYEELKKNPDKYVADPWQATGVILEINKQREDLTTGKFAVDGDRAKTLYFESIEPLAFSRGAKVYLMGYTASGKNSYLLTGSNKDLSIPGIIIDLMIKPEDLPRFK